MSLEAPFRPYKGSRGQCDGWRSRRCLSAALSHKVCHYRGGGTRQKLVHSGMWSSEGGKSSSGSADKVLLIKKNKKQ